MIATMADRLGACNKPYGIDTLIGYLSGNSILSKNSFCGEEREMPLASVLAQASKHCDG